MSDSTEQGDIERLQRAISEQKESAKLLIRRDLELNRANEKLRELDVAKSHFISVVAHQLRTPLSGIKWSLNVLMGETLGPLTDAQRTFLKKCYESNERLIVLINDMLGADRIDSGKMKYDFAPTELPKLVDAILFEISPAIIQKKLQITFINKESNLPKISADEDKMKVALQNVIENAVKYTPEKGQIEIKYEVIESLLKVSVRDTGIGIPEEDQKNVFTRFFRSRNAIKVETNGSGLGLYITKGVIEKHGGKIWFESKLGEGTVFHLTVPIYT